MKILLVTREPFNSPGGGERSMKTIKEFLESKKHKVEVVDTDKMQVKEISRIKRFIGLLRGEVFTSEKKAGEYISKKIKEYKPDIILTQKDYSPLTVKLAREKGIKVVYFLRGLEEFCFYNTAPYCDINKADKDLCISCLKKNTTRPLLKKITIYYKTLQKERYWEAMYNADLVIANSNFMKDLVKRFLGVDCEVLHPSIRTKDYYTKTSREKIGMVHPKEYKGGKIFKKIASRMPETEFVTCRGKIDLPNVEYMGILSDMREFYSKLKILLVPSIWPEPFGRVAVEAMASGIPVIASKVGGLPEAVGKGGITIRDPQKIGDWIKAIKDVSKPQKYNILSNKARIYSEKLDYNKTLPSLEKILLKLVK